MATLVYRPLFPFWGRPFSIFFFFNDTATTEIYTLSLHDALPICGVAGGVIHPCARRRNAEASIMSDPRSLPDRKSTRLNSSHSQISYAVFCLKKKKTIAGSVACRGWKKMHKRLT